ncbi:ABC transporter permease subunit [Nonomuraea sp. NN258]|uniref:ABC transporter permease n=1 Tax=Nonomuraea antri TaxID=2730852 RepID=UPI001568A28B|nr:ABC transporter permease [Nonomuraea antri]NRQ37038.1 ABC transporter permease subunit [Nonomuraea antri]
MSRVNPAKPGNPLNRLVRAELHKARASRVTWVLAAVAPAFCVAWTAVPALLPAPSEEVRLAGVYNMAQQAYVFTMILGILGMAGEFRHRTISWAFLVTPRRGAVVTAKLVAYGLVGLAVSLVSALATLAGGALLLTASGHRAFSQEVPGILAGSVAANTGYALFGVALAVLVRSQVVAIVLACLLLSYGDNFLAWLVPDVFTWLPTGAARALGGMPPARGELLPAWGGGLLFAAYVGAMVLAARLITLRRDVT